VPSWLSTWTATGQSLSIRERGTSEQTVSFNLFTHSFPAGSIVLSESNAGGGNGPSGYIPMLLPACTLPAVHFTLQPLSIVAYRGQPLTLSAAAAGEGLIRYQWRKGATDLADSAHFSGTLGPAMSINSVAFDDGGAYQVMVSDLWSAAASNVATVTVATPCDFDADGDVDQSDFSHLQLCLGAASSNQSCQDAHLDADAAVDLNDVALFVACMSGSGVPAAAQCRAP
jgi:hypothetical protein